MSYQSNGAFSSFSRYLFGLSLVNGLWCNEDVGHCGSGLFEACRLSFGPRCYSLSAHESISSTEISFNLGVQKGCAAPGTPGGSILSWFFFFFFPVEWRDEGYPNHEGHIEQGYRGRHRSTERKQWLHCHGAVRFWTAEVWHTGAGLALIRGGL